MRITSKTINYTVLTVDELLTLNGEENAVVVVTDEKRGGTFVYRSAEVGNDDTGTIFNGWCRQYEGAVNVKWFGASSSRVDNNIPIQAAIDTHRIINIRGAFQISASLNLTGDTIILGTDRDIGYSSGIDSADSIYATSNIGSLITIQGSSNVIKHLALLGGDEVDYGISSIGEFGHVGSHTLEGLSITRFNKSGIFFLNGGLSKITQCQVSNCKEVGIDLQGWGDSDITGCYINTVNMDTANITDSPYDSTVEGVGIRLRKSASGQTGNINIRGGKIEFCRVGIMLNSAQGINITGINFDTCRKASVFVQSDAIPLTSDRTLYNSSISTSVQITGNRFLGGLKGVNVDTAHIIVDRSRFVTITGNNFKRADDAAGDFFGIFPTMGQDYGVWLEQAESCIVVGNDLAYSAIVKSLLVQNDNPTDTEHTIYSNSIDGTEDVHFGVCTDQVIYNNDVYVTGNYPKAKNTAKAWVKFDGQTNSIIDSFNVFSVENIATGNYKIKFFLPMEDANYITIVSADPYGSYDTNALSSTAAVSYAQVVTTVGGVQANVGTINVLIFGI